MLRSYPIAIPSKFSEWVFSLLKYKWKSRRQKINKITKDEIMWPTGKGGFREYPIDFLCSYKILSLGTCVINLSLLQEMLSFS